MRYREEIHHANFLNLHLSSLGKPNSIQCNENFTLIWTIAQSALMYLQILRVSEVSLILPLKYPSAAFLQQFNRTKPFYFWTLVPQKRWKNNSQKQSLKYLSCLLLLSEAFNISFLLCFFWVQCTFVGAHVCEVPHNLKPKILEARINFKIIFFKASHL